MTQGSSLLKQRTHLDSCPGAGGGGGHLADGVQAFLSGFKSARQQRSASLIGWPRANADMNETNTGTGLCQQARQRDRYLLLQPVGGSGRK